MSQAKQSSNSHKSDSEGSDRVAQGSVMPIGGAEDKDADGDEGILQRFIDLAGGSKAHIVVIPTASEKQEEMGQRYVDVFSKLGAKSVEVLDVQQREDAMPIQASRR